MKRILLVDDDASTSFVMKFGLERTGYAVTCAADGQEALASIQREKPDIILTDYWMPKLDGLELARRVKTNSETADVPVVMFTMLAFELSEDEVYRHGVAALLPKPFDPQRYSRVVKQALEGKAEDRRQAKADYRPRVISASGTARCSLAER